MLHVGSRIGDIVDLLLEAVAPLDLLLVRFSGGEEAALPYPSASAAGDFERVETLLADLPLVLLGESVVDGLPGFQIGSTLQSIPSYYRKRVIWKILT